MSRPVLIDANLLVLLIVGLAAPDQVGRHKRVKRYSLAAYGLLLARLQHVERILVTPNVLTEASNLLPSGSESMQQRLMGALQAFIASTPGIGLDVGTEERYVPSTDGIANTNFLRLGLTDATLVAGTPNDVTLLTDDFNLYVAAHRAGRDVEYFTYSLKAAGLL